MPVQAKFIPPMLLLTTNALPDDPARWRYELKLDGYRTIAYKTGGTLYLRSRNNKDFAIRYPRVVAGLATLPNETVIDGEVVAFDEEGQAVVQRAPELRLRSRAGRVLRLRCHGAGGQRIAFDGLS